jgi:ATP-dependent Clp protease ATP-binding subunit ClpA
MQGYNFTERVRKVLAMAREESARLNHEYVGTEHILLGLVREGEGVAATILQNLSVDADEVERVINEVVKKGTPTHRGPDLPYTSRAKKVLELAMAEAREVNHSYVGTEHLLLGLLREEKGIAAQVLHDAGLTKENAREEMLRILGTETPHTATRPQREEFVTIRGPMPAHALPRFMERLRNVIADAHRVAAERQVTEVTPVHLAIALLQHGEGMANAALDRLELDYEAALLALNDLAPMGTAEITPETVIGLDPAGVIALKAMEEAQRKWGAQFAGTQHLLIGLLATSSQVIAVLSAQDIKVEEVIEEIQAISG